MREGRNLKLNMDLMILTGCFYRRVKLEYGEIENTSEKIGIDISKNSVRNLPIYKGKKTSLILKQFKNQDRRHYLSAPACAGRSASLFLIEKTFLNC